jgi:NAD(P)-dependent dehydrogenase (short-subunit alcohol dehydrogenase family)
MKKQTIIITGASSGIGKEVARYFLERGDNVVINSTSPEKLAQAYRELGAGPNLAIVAGDVYHKRTGEQLAATAIEKFGSVDVLVNNAGIFETRPFLEVDEAYLDRFLNTNLKGTYFTTQAVIPQMLKQRDGVVINIGTPIVSHALGGMPTTAPLSSKGGRPRGSLSERYCD